MKQLLGTANILCIAILFVLSSCADTLIGDEGQLDEDIYINYQTKTDLELPFEEEWIVFNGGKTHRQGAHHFVTRGGGERYAYDIVIAKDGKTHTGDRSKNENFYCFGKRLNAPADGKIIALVNDVEDNIPGVVNRQDGSNYIVIDHLNGETSILAHFKKGSIIVAVGDTVVKGQEVGQAGNSGASTEPHLHYQLQQTTPDFFNAMGVPAQFLNYYEDDAFVERGEPVRGQKVRKD